MPHNFSRAESQNLHPNLVLILVEKTPFSLVAVTMAEASGGQPPPATDADGFIQVNHRSRLQTLSVAEETVSFRREMPEYQYQKQQLRLEFINSSARNKAGQILKQLLSIVRNTTKDFILHSPKDTNVFATLDELNLNSNAPTGHTSANTFPSSDPRSSDSRPDSVSKFSVHRMEKCGTYQLKTTVILLQYSSSLDFASIKASAVKNGLFAHRGVLLLEDLWNSQPLANVGMLFNKTPILHNIEHLHKRIQSIMDATYIDDPPRIRLQKGTIYLPKQESLPTIDLLCTTFDKDRVTEMFSSSDDLRKVVGGLCKKNFRPGMTMEALQDLRRTYQSHAQYLHSKAVIRITDLPRWCTKAMTQSGKQGLTSITDFFESKGLHIDFEPTRKTDDEGTWIIVTDANRYNEAQLVVDELVAIIPKWFPNSKVQPQGSNITADMDKHYLKPIPEGENPQMDDITPTERKSYFAVLTKRQRSLARKKKAKTTKMPKPPPTPKDFPPLAPPPATNAWTGTATNANNGQTTSISTAASPNLLDKLTGQVESMHQQIEIIAKQRELDCAEHKTQLEHLKTQLEADWTQNWLNQKAHMEAQEKRQEELEKKIQAIPAELDGRNNDFRKELEQKFLDILERVMEQQQTLAIQTQQLAADHKADVKLIMEAIQQQNEQKAGLSELSSPPRKKQIREANTRDTNDPDQPSHDQSTANKEAESEEIPANDDEDANMSIPSEAPPEGHDTC